VADAILVEIGQFPPFVGPLVKLFKRGEGGDVERIAFENLLIVADLFFHRGIHSR